VPNRLGASVLTGHPASRPGAPPGAPTPAVHAVAAVAAVAEEPFDGVAAVGHVVATTVSAVGSQNTAAGVAAMPAGAAMTNDM
jgi:hypothetical protein